MGRLAAWHLPSGPVGPPARWAAMSNVEGGSGTEGPLAREGGFSSDKLFSKAPKQFIRGEFLPSS